MRPDILVDTRSFRDGIVNKYDLTAAGVIRCGKEHSVAVDAGYARGFEVCNNDNLFTDKLVGCIVVLDAGYDHALAYTVVERELIAGVRLSDLLALYYLANAEIELAEVVKRNSFLIDELNGIGFAVCLLLNCGSCIGICHCIYCLFLVGFRVREIKQVNESVLFYGV